MRLTTIAMLFLMLGSACAHANCDLEKTVAIADSPLPEKADIEIDVANVESAEGGIWEIYMGADNTPQRMFRTDYGETGRTRHSLTTAKGDDFLLSVTRSYYAAPIYEEGSGTIREEIDHYVFCDGKLQVPPNWNTPQSYFDSAKVAAQAYFNAPEVAIQLKNAALTPPTWK